MADVQALDPPPRSPAPSFQQEVMVGDNNPQQFLIGATSTIGNEQAPGLPARQPEPTTEPEPRQTIGTRTWQ